MSENAAFAIVPMQASETKIRGTARLTDRRDIDQRGKAFPMPLAIPNGVGRGKTKISRRRPFLMIVPSLTGQITWSAVNILSLIPYAMRGEYIEKKGVYSLGDSLVEGSVLYYFP